MILGNTGSGKTTLLTWLLAEKLQGYHLALDPHAHQGKWGAIPVFGAGRNYREIAKAIQAIYRLMDARFDQLRSGQLQFATINVCLDEYPAISKSAECQETCQRLIPFLLREARKVGIRIVVLAQGSEVRTLGCEGEGSIRDQFCFIRLGKFAQRTAGELRLQLPPGNWALVEDTATPVPNLANYRPQFAPQPPPADLAALLPLATSRPEVEVAPEVSEPANDKNFPASTSGEDRLIQAISAAREAGKSNTWIIENVLGCRGRRFAEGKAILQRLQSLQLQPKEKPPVATNCNRGLMWPGLDLF